ncbi:MAG: hypothetical protein FJ316_03735 [SAR202 cluster bacterium]|nr:hypothetical protein [SAR202 cluster bacterium]
MTVQEGDYQSLSIHYLENSLHHLQAGEIAKAGEFLWGSVATALKAVAARRDRGLRSHRELRAFARELARDSGQPDLWDKYLTAEHLHSNFYESFLEREDLDAIAEDLRPTVMVLLEMAAEGR